MAQDINYSPEQLDNFMGNISYQWWCEKCLDYHHYYCGLYGEIIYNCPYEDNNYCPHCGQLMRIRR